MATKKNKVSQADVYRLGTATAKVKAGMTPAQWAKIVKTAHAGGWTVDGLLSGDDPALREKTQSSLKAQAQQTVNTAYAPAEAKTTTDLGRAAAWDQKRKDDNASYDAWLTTQRQAQDAQLTSAVSTLADAQKAAATAVPAMWTDAQSQAQGNLAAQNGVVSDPAQAKALDLSAPAAQATQLAASAGTNANDNAHSAIDMQGVLNNASLGMSSARAGQAAADVSKMRSGILDDSAKMAVQKASDVLTQFAKLQDQQVSIAQGKASNDILAQKLGVQQDQLQINAGKLNLAATTATATEKDKAADRALTRAKLAIDKGKSDLNGDGKIDSKDYKLKKEIDASTKAGAPAKPATGAQQTRSASQWSSVVNALHQLQDWHAGKNAPKAAGFRQVLARRGAPQLVIDVAEDLRKHNGKLSPRGVQKAKELGILNPGSLVP